jgi:hypothetical protein
VNYDFLYEWVRFDEVFMTILTDIRLDLLLNVDIGKNIGSCEPDSRHVIFRLRFRSRACKCKGLLFAYASSLECFQGGFFSEITQTLRGVGTLCLKTSVSEKLKFLPPCASAHSASAVAEACKTPHFKSFPRASSQTIEMGSFAAIEIPIFKRWCCRHRFVTVL